MDNIFDDLPSLCPDDESSDDDFDGFQWVTKDAIYEEIAEDSDDGEAEVEEDGPPLRRQRRVYAGGRGTGRPFCAPPRAIFEDEHGLWRTEILLNPARWGGGFLFGHGTAVPVLV